MADDHHAHAIKIPSFDLTRQYALIQNELEPAVLRVLRSGKYISSDEGKALESELAAFLKTKHAFGVANGSDALVLALMALGIGQGDEVITTPFTFFATAGCVARVNAKPVFVDVRADTYNIDEKLIEHAITPKTKAIIVVHLYGQMCAMDKIMEIASKHKIPVIEDAAQAIGAAYKGKPAGSWGDITCYSFFPTKNLGAAGDAGLVTTNDEVLAGKLKILRVHGASKKYHHDLVGMNSRLDEVQAAILRVKLQHLSAWTARRRGIAMAYTRALTGVSGITTPALDKDAVHIFHQYTIRAAQRDELMTYLAAKGIGSTVYYPVSLTRQECFSSLRQQPDCPVSDKLTHEVLSLPLFPEMTDAEVQEVIASIKAFK